VPDVPEPPHPNGSLNGSAAGGDRPRRAHAPWEFLILSLFVALVCVGIILGWTLVGSHSPERLDQPAAATASSACNDAQAKLKALPNPNPTLGADRVTRVRAENTVLRGMVAQFALVRPAKSTPASALRDWGNDWTRMIDARASYADQLAALAGTQGKVRFIYPATNGIKPITEEMDDFVRENHPNLDACFTTALQLEVVEGQRTYQKVTS